MDPNEAYKKINESIGEIYNELYDSFDPDSQVGQIITHFEALDNWLSRGGFLPDEWERKPVNPCNCEHASHFDEPDSPRTSHKYMRVPADRQTARYVGDICDECADTHMKEYLIYSLSDCINYAVYNAGDCGGRVELVDGAVVCENCRNRKPPFPFQDESEKRAEDWRDDG